MSLAVNTQKRMRLICTAATLGFVLVSPSSFGAGDGPFAGLSGAWAGGGDISMADGSRERILCRARYSVGEAGRSLVQHLRCASASYRLEISADVQDRGGALYGSWSEAAHGESGSISGSVAGSVVRAQVHGGNFSAGIGINLRGNSQSVTITPSSGTGVRHVTIFMHRA